MQRTRTDPSKAWSELGFECGNPDLFLCCKTLMASHSMSGSMIAGKHFRPDDGVRAKGNGR